MPSSRIKGSSPFRQLLKTRDTPDEETSDWRAVCGKTARTVRRAGRVDTLPDPYRIVNHATVEAVISPQNPSAPPRLQDLAFGSQWFNGAHSVVEA